MIYDKYLTIALIGILGAGCEDWSKVKIRNELESKVYNVHEKMINEENDMLRNEMFKVYKTTKLVEDAYMEYYTTELDTQERIKRIEIKNQTI